MTFTLPGLGGAAWGPVNNDALSNLNERVTDLEVGVVSDAFKPSHAYSVGDIVQHSDGSRLRCITAYTSGSSIDLSKFEPVSTHAGTVEQVALSATYAAVFTPVGNTAADTAALQAKINAGGRILVNAPLGAVVVNTLTMKSGAIIDLGGATLQLAIGANADLIHGYQFETLTGTDGTGGISDWAIVNGKLDGNAANQTLTGRTDTGVTVTSGSPTVTDASITSADVGKALSGTGIPFGACVGPVSGSTFTIIVGGIATNATANGTSATVTPRSMPLRVYGYDYRIDNLEIFGGASGNAYSEWSSQSPDGFHMETIWTRFKLSDLAGAGNINLEWAGPHDSMFSNGIVIGGHTGSEHYGIWQHGHSGGEVFSNVHTWGFHKYGWILEHSHLASNCQAEGATTVNLWIKYGPSIWQGYVYGSSGYHTGETGVRIGDTGATISGAQVNVRLSGFDSTSFPLDFLGSSGGNRVQGIWSRGSGGALYQTAPHINDDIDVVCSDDQTKTFNQIGHSLSLNSVSGGQSPLLVKVVGSATLEVSSNGIHAYHGFASKWWSGLQGTTERVEINGATAAVNFGTAAGGLGARKWSGSGAPTTPGGAITYNLGDIYERTDTPGTVGQRTYRVTTAGITPTWTADEASLVPSTRQVNGHTLSADVVLTKADVGLSNVPNVDTTNASNITTGTLPSSVMPPLAINDTFTVASQAAMLALTAQRGDVAIRTDTNNTYILSTDSPTTLADWKQVLTPADGVTSVNGSAGPAVVLTASDVGATPTTRLLAGLDLSADRTAAALKTALAIGESDVTNLTTDLANKQTKFVAGTCATAIGTTAKTVTIGGYALTAGDVLAITFTNGSNVGAVTLAVNGGSAINILAAGANQIAALNVSAGAAVFLYYDGTNFQTVGIYNNGGPPSQSEAEVGTTTTSRFWTAQRVKQSAANTQVNTQTGTTYTFVATDAGCRVEGNNASAITFTIPPNSSVAFSIGAWIEIEQYGAGAITIAAGAGVTLRSRGALVNTNGQYSVVRLYKRATDEWVLSGDRV